ncbi:PAS domain S-box protein [Quadrisphaera sp. INWT6]|nr:PAS domain S-box protein [Quadrisphaera sp. INWT6]
MTSAVASAAASRGGASSGLPMGVPARTTRPAGARCSLTRPSSRAGATGRAAGRPSGQPSRPPTGRRQARSRRCRCSGSDGTVGGSCVSEVLPEHRRPVRRWAARAVPAAWLLAAGLLARQVHLPGSDVALVWPVTGLAVLWVARHRGLRQRAAVLACTAALCALVRALTGAPLTSALLGGAADAVAAGVVVAVLRAAQRGPLRLERGGDVWALAAACLCGALAGGLVSAPLLAAEPESAHAALVQVLGTAAGGLVVVAVRLLLQRPRAGAGGGHRQQGLAGPAESVALWLGGGAAFVGVFVVLDGAQLAFATLPLAVWAALRLPARATAAHLLLAAATALGGTLADRGPFAAMPAALAVATCQAYAAVLVVVAVSICLHRDERSVLTAELGAALARTREQTALMQAVHQAVTEGIVVYSADGASLSRNPAAEALLGANPRRGQPRSWEGAYQLLHPDGSTPDPQRLPVVRALRGEAVIGEDLLVIGPGGPQGRLLNVDAHPLPDAEGAAWSGGAVAVFHDVTEERTSAAAAARTRDLLAGVLDGATELGVVATDTQHRITVFSSGAERMLGRTSAEVVGTTPEAHLPPELLLGPAEGGSATGRWDLVRRDGSTFTAEVTRTPMLDDDGAVVGTIAVFTDATTQIAAEQRLADSEEQFRLAFETNPTGMLVMSLDPGEVGRLVRVNTAFAAFTGRRRTELLGGRVRDLLHPDDVAGHLDRLGRIARGERVAADGLEQRFTRPDGSVRWARTSPSLIQPSDGSAPPPPGGRRGRHRGARRGRGAAPRRPARPADRAAEPRAARRAPAGRPGGGRPGRRDGRLHRPRRLQAGQRHPRPRRG